MPRRLAGVAAPGAGDLSGLAGVVERRLKVLVDGRLVDPEGAPDADGGQLAGVHETVDRHLGDTHDLRDLGDRQEGPFIFIGHKTT